MRRRAERSRRRLERGILFGTIVLLASLASLSFAGAATAQQGVGITVTVAPSAPGDASGDATGDSTGNSNGGAASDDGTAVAGETPTEAPGGSGLGGIVFVSGLTSHYVWSLNPVDNRVRLEFTVRNDAKSTFSARSKFWIETPLGSRIGQASVIPIPHLKPGETRRIETTIGGAGQWTVLHAHVLFTPPRAVDTTKMMSVTRDSFVVVPPLLVGGSALALVFGLTVLRAIWITRAVSLAGAV